MRKTKVVCTIGPSSKEPDILEKLIKAGMDVARINASHCEEKEIEDIFNSIKKISSELGSNTAVMLDLQGPKIRVGDLKNELILVSGQSIIFTTAKYFKKNVKKYSDEYKVIQVNYTDFIKDIKSDSEIFIDDGLIECKVKKLDRKEKIAVCEVIRGGTLKSRKGINLPGVSVSSPSVTKNDLRFLQFGLELGVDFIAQSFVRDPKDVEKIKNIISEKKNTTMVIAKIEKYEAVDGFKDILGLADGIMIARGDLGIEIDEEEVPLIQKRIIKETNLVGKPVITATQMLDSMIRNPRPTRAEVSDVANAILDGSDAVMLSGETAAGKYPLESLQMMIKIIKKTESALDYKDIINKKFGMQKDTITEAISFAACEIASVLKAKAVITSTQSGNTARQVSKNKPSSIIMGASPYDWVVRQLMISWGVIPFKTEMTKNIDQMIKKTIETIKESKHIKKGDKIILTGGVMLNKPGGTNFINVYTVS